MGQLRDRMGQDLILRGFRPATRRNYLFYCRRFAAFFKRSPEELGEAEIRQFLLHYLQVQHCSHDTYRQIRAALRFLYAVTLKRTCVVAHLPVPRRPRRRLPEVLSPQELAALFNALEAPMYRAVFMTCYAAGLRISEACHLRVADIDSQRMVLRIRDGKGGQDRFSLLSPRLLVILERASPRQRQLRAQARLDAAVLGCAGGRYPGFHRLHALGTSSLPKSARGRSIPLSARGHAL